MKKRTADAAVAVIVAILVASVFLAPVVTFRRTVNVSGPPKPTIIELDDKGSVGYLLFGLGVAPFQHVITKVVTINGTLFTLNYTGSEWGLTPGTEVPSPLAIESVRATLNHTEFPKLDVYIVLHNGGDQVISWIAISQDNITASGLGGVENVAPNQTKSAAFQLYLTPPPTLGETISLRLHGTLANSSYFYNYVTARVQSP